jgi:magnesium-dependent phosphatase 1
MPFSLIVFDLDFTLWNAGNTWCDNTFPPYRRTNNHIIDAEQNTIFLYPGVKSLLKTLQKDHLLGIASRTSQPKWAVELMRLFEIDTHFRYCEIYPGSKTNHFYQFRQQSNIPYQEMLFFDDEQRNVNEVAQLGVKAVWVEQGITSDLVNNYLF